MSARNFSRALGVADNNTQNYISQNPALPKADYLEKVLTHFQSINPTWLITGQGEPFLPSSSENTQPLANGQKFFRTQVIGSNQGTAIHEQNTTPAGEEALKTKLTLAEQEIQHLRTQLEMQAALLAAKDETIGLLRGSYRNPN